MARPRGTSFARRAAPKRKTIWVGAAEQGDVAVASTTSVVLQSFAPDDFGMLAPTVVRTRGVAIIHPGAFSADLDFDGAYGLCIVSDEALVAGAGSIPRPFDDDSWPGWIVHRYFVGHFNFDTAVGSETYPNVDIIDSKAMRKVGPNEVLVWMCESRLGAVSINVHARILFKLS